MNIYYLTASLPALQFGGKLMISLQDFLDQCARLLSRQQCHIIRAAFDDKEDDAGQRTLRAYRAFIGGLRNELARFRATEQNKDPQLFLRASSEDIDPATVDVLGMALEQTDPLSAQKVLDAFIWKKLDELQAQHYFDIDGLIVYGLKLQILERYAAIESSAGRQRFEDIKTAAAEKYIYLKGAF